MKKLFSLLFAISIFIAGDNFFTYAQSDESGRPKLPPAFSIEKEIRHYQTCKTECSFGNIKEGDVCVAPFGLGKPCTNNNECTTEAPVCKYGTCHIVGCKKTSAGDSIVVGASPCPSGYVCIGSDNENSACITCEEYGKDNFFICNSNLYYCGPGTGSCKPGELEIGGSTQDGTQCCCQGLHAS